MAEKSVPHIIITSPSLNTEDNVSGIANLTHLLKQYNTDTEYVVFIAGKKDDEKRNLRWFFSQFYVLYSFFLNLKKNNVHLAHINMPMGNLSIIRDSFFSILCRVLNKEYLLHFRGGRYSMNEDIPWFLKFFVNISLKKARKIIVLGNEEKGFLMNFYKVQEHKIVVMPNCVKIPDISAKKLPDNNTIKILFLGRIDKNKGLKESVDALASINNINYKFIAAGDGADKSWFLDYAEKKLKNHFDYKGIISGHQKHEVLLNSHVFLMPSYYEGLPNALLEAMSYGLVPIVTPVGSIPEVVKHEKNGILVSANNHKEIKDCLKMLIRKPDIYSVLSENSISTIKDNYSSEEYINRLNKVYSKVRN